jgi:hypothetical protein
LMILIENMVATHTRRQQEINKMGNRTALSLYPNVYTHANHKLRGKWEKKGWGVASGNELQSIIIANIITTTSWELLSPSFLLFFHDFPSRLRNPMCGRGVWLIVIGFHLFATPLELPASTRPHILDRNAGRLIFQCFTSKLM